MSAPPPFQLAGLTRAEFETRAHAALGLGPGHNRALGQIYRRALREGRLEAREGELPRGAWEGLGSAFRLDLPESLRVTEEEAPEGRVAKALLRLGDGQTVECVRIPVAGRDPERPPPSTLCVSSQVGCRMGCAFCETGTMGLLRDLEASEIVGQLLAARFLLGWEIGNIVFMGMGEPLDNFTALAKALAVLLDPTGLAFAQEDLTVCSSGLPEGVRALRGLGLKRLNLSVSLNAGSEEVRAGLMPITRAFGLAGLAAALRAYPQRRNFVLGVNYCLIPGLNDGPGAAEAVADFLAAAAEPGRALLNLIPYNPGSQPLGRAPTEEEVSAFSERLAGLGVLVKLRSPRGRGLMAACGQLRGSSGRCSP